MGSLAGLLARRGFEVTGSDEGVYPPMSSALERWGIPVTLGFDPRNVLERRPDLVVIGNAVRADNPEARAAIDGGLAYSSFPDALYEHAIRGRHSVVVTGTHGKTTTASLAATLLHEAGRDPSLLVGGITANFDGSFRDGAGPEFVVEGDEYDSAFFDKTPKFLHYHPDTLVLTSIEFDHADIYRDLAHVESEFEKLVAGLAGGANLLAAAGAESIERVLRAAPCRVKRYGIECDADLRAHGLRASPEGTAFRVEHGSEHADAFLPMHGEHNVGNALAALGVLLVRGVALADAAPLVARFRGVKRRQEVRGEAAGVLVLDDFAHHPTAVRATLAGLRARFPGRRIVAVFEPRSNTSRRALFQDAFAEAFDDADRVVVQQVADEPIYSATGEVGERLSADLLAHAIRARGLAAEALPDVDAIVSQLARTCREGDVVVTLSNGGFGGIWQKLLAALGEPAGARTPARPGA
jgi:UDP-N-acetylmuramate: L-alanyl-gamma-D-glutamyl-meso-diaminopimelate ligase